MRWNEPVCQPTSAEKGCSLEMGANWTAYRRHYNRMVLPPNNRLKIPASSSGFNRIVAHGGRPRFGSSGVLRHIPAMAAWSIQTWEEQTLEILQAAIAGNMSQNVQSYQIAGRAVSHYRLKTDEARRDFQIRIVWRQTIRVIWASGSVHSRPFKASSPFRRLG